MLKPADYNWGQWSGDVKSVILALVLFKAFTRNDAFTAAREKYETNARIEILEESVEMIPEMEVRLARLEAIVKNNKM